MMIRIISVLAQVLKFFSSLIAEIQPPVSGITNTAADNLPS